MTWEKIVYHDEAVLDNYRTSVVKKLDQKIFMSLLAHYDLVVLPEIEQEFVIRVPYFLFPLNKQSYIKGAKFKGIINSFKPNMKEEGNPTAEITITGSPQGEP